MKIKIQHHNLFSIFSLVIFLTSSFMGQGPANGQEAESSYRKMVPELKKRISELQEGNALLMENLINCVEENDALKQTLEKKSQINSIDSNGNKPAIIESIRKLLRTDDDLSFLMKIEEDELKILFEIIKKGKGP
jgi:predicted RNase H-like nuclease (RuvC/YqgF family)